MPEAPPFERRIGEDIQISPSARFFTDHLAGERDSRYIIVGENFFAQKPTIIRTLLGSCVSVCLYSPRTLMGGMNHILVPGKGNEQSLDTRMGINAMELLINEFVKRGIARNELQAKVFGGGNILKLDFREKMLLGDHNTRFVLDFLVAEKIPVLARDTGGEFIRKIRFISDTFEVYQERSSVGLWKIAEQESNYRQRLRKRILEKEIDRGQIFD